MLVAVATQRVFAAASGGGRAGGRVKPWVRRGAAAGVAVGPAGRCRAGLWAGRARTPTAHQKATQSCKLTRLQRLRECSKAEQAAQARATQWWWWVGKGGGGGGGTHHRWQDEEMPGASMPGASAGHGSAQLVQKPSAPQCEGSVRAHASSSQGMHAASRQRWHLPSTIL